MPNATTSMELSAADLEILAAGLRARKLECEKAVENFGLDMSVRLAEIDKLLTRVNKKGQFLSEFGC